MAWKITQIPDEVPQKPRNGCLILIIVIIIIIIIANS